MKILVWGTGETTTTCLENISELEQVGIEIVGFIDNNSSKWNTKYLGKPVFSPAIIQETVFDKLVICVRGKIYTEIYRQVAYDMGVEDEKIESFLWLLNQKGLLRNGNLKQTRDPHIYDCFIFYNELELLELRLKMLAPYVDYFVIAEMKTDFKGQKKPCYFWENRDRFDEYKDKILYVCSDDVTEMQSDKGKKGYALDYPRIMYLRNSLQRKLEQCQPMDYMLLSDVDEIPNPEILKRLKAGSGKINKDYLAVILQSCPVVLEQKFFYYFMNLVQDIKWYGTSIIQYRFLNTFEELRSEKDKQSLISIPDGGWHFSYMGGIERITQKIKVSNEAEEIAGGNLTEDVLKDRIENKKDILGRESYGDKEVKLECLENYKDLGIDGIEDFILKYPYMWKKYE